MDLSQTKSNSISILRQQAEDILKGSNSNSELNRLSSQTLELLHELEVHQMELKLQNEELMQSQILAQDAIDLYNYAPNGYFTLSPTTEIIDLNNTGATLLKKEKSKLIGSSFGFYVSDATKPILANFLHKVLRDKNRESCEITLSLSESEEIFVQLTGIVNKTGDQCLVTLIDVTEQKQAVLALKQSDARFQTLFNKAPLGYQSLDFDGCFLEVNQQWLVMLGYNYEEVIGKWFGDFLAPHYKDGFRKRFPIFKAQGHIHSEFEMIHKDGSMLFIAFDGKIGYDASGDFKQTHCILQDITESNRTKNALKESEEKFRNIYENSIVGKSVTSIDGKLKVNKAFCETVGYSEEELNQMKWQDITHKDDVELNERIVKSLLSGAKDSARWEKRFIHKNGNTVWTDLSTSLQRDGSGNPLYFISSINDITERKRAERDLNESREQYKDLFENAPIGYHEIDVEGKIIRMNKTELNMLGYSVDEVIGMFLWEFALDKTHSKQSISAKLKGDVIPTVPFEREYRKKDGTTIPVLVQDVILRDSVGHILGIRSTVQDITERKKAEQALQNSKEMMISSQSVAHICSYSTTLNENDLEKSTWICSPEFYEIFGIDETYPHTIAGWVGLIHPDHRDELIAYHAFVIKNKISFSHEYKIIRIKDGAERWVEGTGEHEYDEQGNPVRMYGSIQDITERKNAQVEIIEREVQYHNLANSGTALIWAAGLDKLCFYFNDPWLKFTGRKLEQELGNGWTESVHPDDFDQCLNTYVTSFDKMIAFEMEYRMRNAKGEYRWILDLGTPNYNSSGEFVGYIGHCFDITERKNTEDALQESEKKMSALFTSMTEMVVLHELVLNEIGQAIDYKILDCNDKFTQITGIEKDDAIGKLASQVYHTQWAPYLEEYTKVCITGESMEYKTYYQPLDKHFIISAISTGVNQFATITTDITAIEKTHEVIKEKNKELENYIYVASHDLRSPLVNIQGFSQRLGRQTNELKSIVQKNTTEETIKTDLDRITNEDIPKSINFILSNVLKMDTLINGLLQLSRTGRILMTIQKIDMNELMKSVLSAHNYELTEIDANVQIDDLADCYGDENQLNQLFSNLINNAVKYRDKNRQLKIQIASKNQYKRVIYSIKDSGIGINARHLEKIWDVFYRVDSSSLEAGEGIGLSLARRIVDKHEGKIWVESEVGKGSTFYIELHRYEFGE